MSLTPGDFSRPVVLEDGAKYDEYGIRLPPNVLEEFGLLDEAWYVKFALIEGNYEDETYCLSLHPLEKPMYCVSGRIVPSTRDLP
ncbi:hypothetical protein HRD49_41720 [Corallococcus exiguus]|uniref:hypothetical protein n=1 Tax=Corallococcus exiguus TaxID=83462 RepID=UPI001560F7FF|nr:hypothetical protein [Corallococcus exiguus]NRD68264.1 hypothetical protein [Corallococcus exiguus]